MMTTAADKNVKAIPSYLARTLTEKVQAIEFDPAKREHRKAYAEFVQTSKWTIRFVTKWPMSIEQTVEKRLAQWACKKEWN